MPIGTILHETSGLNSAVVVGSYQEGAGAIKDVARSLQLGADG